MRINLIAAVGKNYELGKCNKLIWHIREDMEFFKKLTRNRIIVMGENTFSSIGTPLAFRKNIVLSFKRKKISGVTVLNDYRDVFKYDEDIFIIGGASIYKLFLPFCDNIYLTEIDDEQVADCYFPLFDKNEFEREVIKKSDYNGIDITFVRYRRIYGKIDCN